eukprot:scaffold1076_cov342-Prasinococcus_capsulatus_cf.AAC.5
MVYVCTAPANFSMLDLRPTMTGIAATCSATSRYTLIICRVCRTPTAGARPVRVVPASERTSACAPPPRPPRGWRGRCGPPARGTRGCARRGACASPSA